MTNIGIPRINTVTKIWSQNIGEMRLPTISEKEVIMGFPLGYTSPCRPKSLQVGRDYHDARHTLIGNTWNVSVVAWLMGNLFFPLGPSKVSTVDQMVKQTSPGRGTDLRTYLQRGALQATPFLPTLVHWLRSLLASLALKGKTFFYKWPVKTAYDTIGSEQVYQLNSGVGR